MSFGESVSFETFQVDVFSFFIMMQFLDVDAKVTYTHRMHGTGKYLPTCQRKIKPQKSFGHEKYRILSDILYYLYLEPETSILKCLFHLHDSESLNEKNSFNKHPCIKLVVGSSRPLAEFQAIMAL